MTNNPFKIHPSAHVSHVEYQVRDVTKLLSFYGDLMGMQLVDKSDSVARLSSNGKLPALLTLIEHKESRPAPSNSPVPGLYHTAFRFPGRGPLASTLLRIVAAGYPLQGASDHLFSEAVYLADPEGNGIEIYRDRPREEWPKMDEALQSGNLPLDLSRLLDEADQAAAQAGKVDERMDIGHIHLQVSDLAKADVFYHQQLGLDVMMALPTALFFAAGGYHHHVGANTWHSLNVSRRTEDLTGLRSFAFEIPDEDGWLKIFERVKNRETQRMERDERLGFRIQDADGINVEVLTPSVEKVRSAMELATGS